MNGDTGADEPDEETRLVEAIYDITEQFTRFRVKMAVPMTHVRMARAMIAKVEQLCAEYDAEIERQAAE